MKKIKLVLAILMICCMAFTVTGGLCASAVAYSGSGTMADPYLVQTAEQLQGMRENLSAHYKLAANIDLSGMSFKPVGRLDKPFTGSFVCELNSDNTPKYIIKNLKIEVAATEYAGEKINKWEAALFGAAENATFSGIYILDINIKNDVLGDNRGSVVYGNYKPGMDEMNAAALVGDASSCTIMNCAATGVINGKASGVGGLLGRLNNSTVDNCYSTVEIKTEGKWSIGGLIGYVSDSDISSCYTTGNVKGGQTNIGGFIGTITRGSVTNCYATGNVSGGKQTKTAFGSHQLENPDAQAEYKNCFALGSVLDANSAGTEFKNIENCWVLSGTNHYMKGFKEGSKAEIKSAFAQISEWDTSGEYPTLKNIGVVSDASKYPVGAGVQSNTESNTSQTASSSASSSQQAETSSAVNSSSVVVGSSASQTTAQNTSSAVTSVIIEGNTSSAVSNSISSQETASSSASEVAALIEALPDYKTEGAITLENKEQIKTAWNAYQALSDIEKEDFDANTFAKLNNAKKTLSLLMLADTIDRTMALPEVDELTSEQADEVLAIYEDFSFIDDSLKTEVEPAVIEKLNAAYEWAKNAQEETAVAATGSLTKWEIIACIFYSVIILLAVAFDVFIGIILARRYRKVKENDDDLAETETE